ncbi:MAG: hypothetical protein ABSD11_11910 [Methylocella sp.]|jgi:hypothetical protein
MTAYKDAWIAYFRAEAAADEARLAYFANIENEEPDAVIDSSLSVAIAARREAFVAEDLADSLTEGQDYSTKQEELLSCTAETALARQEAIRVLRKAKRRTSQ